MSLDSISQIECLESNSNESSGFLSIPLLKSWLDGFSAAGLKKNSKADWNPTPIKTLDLSSIGYGVVYVKDESDRSSNPTGTIKDRAAWEVAKLYRNFSIGLLDQYRKNIISKDAIEKTPVPRISLVTSGNEGVALARCFKVYGLPKPKALVDANISFAKLEFLKQEYLELYQVELSREPLDSNAIKKKTNNVSGIDLTSVRSFHPGEIFYDWHVHEAFNFKPEEIYLPYGSGRLFENYLNWQTKSIRNFYSNSIDYRLQTDPITISKMSIHGSEPLRLDSSADKLTSPFKPFKGIFKKDIQDQKIFLMTGRKTDVYGIPEDFIKEANTIMNSAGILAEPSGSAGLALFLFKNRKRKNLSKRTLIVNTGCGVLSGVPLNG